jgi:hypothetical protein
MHYPNALGTTGKIRNFCPFRHQKGQKLRMREQPKAGCSLSVFAFVKAILDTCDFLCQRPCP